MDILSVLLGALGIAAAVAYLWLWVRSLLEIARSPLTDTARAVWVLVIVLAPVVGLFAWLMLRPQPLPGAGVSGSAPAPRR